MTADDLAQDRIAELCLPHTAALLKLKDWILVRGTPFLNEIPVAEKGGSCLAGRVDGECTNFFSKWIDPARPVATTVHGLLSPSLPPV